MHGFLLVSTLLNAGGPCTNCKATLIIVGLLALLFVLAIVGGFAVIGGSKKDDEPPR